MQDSWINHGIYPLLENIGSFQNYFSNICIYIAAICLLMTLLMTVVKVFLGVANAREQIIKMGVNFCLYCFFMFCYPIAMRAILPFAMNLGYGAIFSSSGIQVNDKFSDFADAGASRNEFYKWVGENSGNIFTQKGVDDKDGKDSQVMLNMNFVDAQTGYMDLNKILLYVLAFLNIGFKAFPKVSLLNCDLTLILACFIYFLAVIVATACFLICIIQYITCLMDYFSLMGFGILTIPLSLWDGTKSYTEKLFGSIGSILIKLVVISAFMCLAVFGILDFFCELFLSFKSVGFSWTVKDYTKLIELAVSLVLKSFVLLTLTMNTTKIAGFINGGSPTMSLGEAAIGAGATAGAAMLAGQGAKGVANVRGGAVLGAARSADAFGTGFSISRKAGEGTGDSLASGAKSALATAGSSLTRSAGSAIKGMPQAARRIGSTLANMTGMSRGISAEGFGGLGMTGSGSAGGSSAAGGRGSSSGNSENIKTGQDIMGSSKSYTDRQGNTKITNALENNGADSVYGIAKVSRDENGNISGYDTLADKMIGQAGSLSTGSYLDQKKAFFMGTAGAVMQSLNNARIQRDMGNSKGNHTIQALGRGFKSGAVGAVAGASNSGGGIKVRFNSGGAAAKINGSSHVAFRRNSANTKALNSNNEMVSNPLNWKKE